MMTKSRHGNTLGTVLLCVFCCMHSTVAAKTIHKEKSLYRNIVVRESNNRRCLVFSVKRGDKNQTCTDLRDPNLLVFAYVRMVFAGLLVNPKPNKILVIGLGGGSIPTTLSELFPNAGIDIVEIDDAVVRVAKKYFAFQENERMKVIVSDARVYIRRATQRGQQYDMIILDAFTGDYIPEHLMTVEFLEEAKQLMTADGALIANTFSNSLLYHHESVTYQRAFKTFFNFKMSFTGNRVIIATTKQLPELKLLTHRAHLFADRLDRYGIEFESYPDHMSREIDWDPSKKPLTDQFSPANLLRGD
ncbi:MAG: fused MFS/spermidine synthase [Pseudomonadales bacterium]|nr:fused MFS/spermidine synthase [Pseudomonadales bacterium]MDP7357675.1 fused MFS/spermidine synthase [Pseudomonadales bacterium]MDP7594048.1 fused MFS/spermidine synthase [Pseudomonadales bacterium]HJN49895.1 fused MFS/spermidine synthase [Pseudomonadales bacterium]